MENTKCTSCAGATRIIDVKRICIYCHPTILSTVNLLSTNTEHLQAGYTLELPLDFELNKILTDQYRTEIGTITEEASDNLKKYEKEYSFSPVVYQKTSEKFSMLETFKHDHHDLRF
jgi:formyltetrahydrofolate synthetase